MYYFVGKIYQSIKATTAVSGVVGSLLAIIYGALIIKSGGTVIVIGGSLCMANSLFNIVEVGKVNFDIKKQIKALDTSLEFFVKQNDVLTENVSISKKNNEDQARENKRLQEIVTKAEKHINKLEKIQQELAKTKEDLATENQILSETSKEMQTQLAEVKILKNDLQSENDDFSATVQELRDQVDVIERLKEQSIEETKSLHDNNEQLAAQITHQTKIIADSRALIKKLAQFGDDCTTFGETLGNELDRLGGTTEDLDHLSRVFTTLGNKLEGETFDKLDTDGDSVITKKEFQEGLSKL